MIVSIDWLECFCKQSADLELEPDIFKNAGFKVVVRDYGTPQYKQMFTIFGDDGFSWVEVRRLPYSLKANGGVFEAGACHIRLCNRTLYLYDAIKTMRQFCLRWKLELLSINRIDICCDFTVFKFGLKPETFIKRYVTEEYAKINQPQLDLHGFEHWHGKEFHSLKWGAESSIVSTKLYDKTKELSRDGHSKIWILQRWLDGGLISLQKVVYPYINKKTGEMEMRVKEMPVERGTATDEVISIDDVKPAKVWRVEFAIKPSGNRFVDEDTGECWKMGLSDFDTDEKLIGWFARFADIYFRFVVRSYTKNGTIQRKDRCKRVDLWPFSNLCCVKLTRVPEREDVGRTDKMLVNRILNLIEKYKWLTQEERDTLCETIQILNRCVAIDKVLSRDLLYERLTQSGCMNNDLFAKQRLLDAMEIAFLESTMK